jgi:hypothetical protein
MPLSTYGKDVLAGAMTGQYALPTDLYLAFTTQIAGPDDTGSTLFESAFPGRFLVPFSADWSVPAAGLTSYNLPMIFTPYDDWGTFDSYALCTASTLGSVFAYDYLASPMTARAYTTLTVPANTFSVQVI